MQAACYYENGILYECYLSDYALPNRTIVLNLSASFHQSYLQYRMHMVQIRLRNESFLKILRQNKTMKPLVG